MLVTVALAGTTPFVVTAVGRAPVPTAVAADGDRVSSELDGLRDDVPAVPPLAQTIVPEAKLLAGAAAIDIAPRPDDFGGTWVQDFDACATLSESTVNALAGGDVSIAEHLASVTSPWPENPDCIYMGGFGLGPMNPMISVDEEHGLWVRAMALSDGTDTAALAVVDGEGWLWDYASKCNDCGAKQIAERVAAATGVDAAGIVVAATHAHSSPDFIGGWGMVPDWYMTQVTESIVEALTTSITTMRPSIVEVGEQSARPFNRERRDTYRSAEEQQLTWLRAWRNDGATGKKTAVFTLGAYAAHPTNFGTNDGVGHADWLAKFTDRLEERFGGVGIEVMTGLGNMSSGGMGRDPQPDGVWGQQKLADLIPDFGGGHIVTGTDLVTERTTFREPLTNVPLSALGIPGFFDRQFDAMPASVRTGKSPDTAPCVSASAWSVELPASAFRIGDELVMTASPGEIFSNVSNTIKEKSGARVTIPMGQANDALGYMPQEFELNPVGQQGLGFVAGGYLIVNYEDSYSIDRCVGDMVLETTIALMEATRG